MTLLFGVFRQGRLWSSLINQHMMTDQKSLVSVYNLKRDSEWKPPDHPSTMPLPSQMEGISPPWQYDVRYSVRCLYL